MPNKDFYETNGIKAVFDVCEGTSGICSFVGPSGSGKSTLATSMALHLRNSYIDADTQEFIKPLPFHNVSTELENPKLLDAASAYMTFVATPELTSAIIVKAPENVTLHVL